MIKNGTGLHRTHGSGMQDIEVEGRCDGGLVVFGSTSQAPSEV